MVASQVVKSLPCGAHNDVPLTISCPMVRFLMLSGNGPVRPSCLSEGYGEIGGIAKFRRHRASEAVVAQKTSLDRLVLFPNSMGMLPERLLPAKNNSLIWGA